MPPLGRGRDNSPGCCCSPRALLRQIRFGILALKRHRPTDTVNHHRATSLSQVTVRPMLPPRTKYFHHAALRSFAPHWKCRVRFATVDTNCNLPSTSALVDIISGIHRAGRYSACALSSALPRDRRNSSTRYRCASAGESGQDNAYRTAPAGSHQSFNRGRRLHRGHSCSIKTMSRNHQPPLLVAGKAAPTSASCGGIVRGIIFSSTSTSDRDLKTTRHTLEET